MANQIQYATKKELEAYKKYCERMMKEAIKSLKKWDVKQDKKVLKRKEK